MNVFLNRYVILLLLILIFPVMVNSDIVRVSDGGSFTGIIISDTPEYLEMDMGTGTMRIQRKYIISFHKSTELERERIRKEWRQKYFLNKKYIPSGQEDVVKRFNRIRQQRALAMRKSAELKKLTAQQKKEQKKLEDLKRQYHKTNIRLKKASVKYNTISYNKLVKEVNSLAADINIRTEKITGLDYSKQAEVIADYIAEVDDFTADIKRRMQTVQVHDNSYYFYNNLLQKLKQYDNDFPEDLIKSRTIGNSTYVSVRINNKTIGKFVLDTGADTMTISKDFANRLGIKIIGLPEIKMRVADGRVVTGYSVILDSVQIGRCRSYKVPAVIMSGAEREHDGLLGMTFLRDYIVDLRNGKLSLRKLD